MDPDRNRDERRARVLRFLSAVPLTIVVVALAIAWAVALDSRRTEQVVQLCTADGAGDSACVSGSADEVAVADANGNDEPDREATVEAASANGAGESGDPELSATGSEAKIQPDATEVVEPPAGADQGERRAEVTPTVQASIPLVATPARTPGATTTARPSPTGEPTVVATPNPTPTPTPAPTSSRSQLGGPVISPTAAATPRPAAPTATPSATPRPTAAATPRPAAPTATPSATPRPAVTATPTVTPTAMPTVTAAPVGPQPFGQSGNWTLIFQDDFDYLDTSKWETAWFSSFDYTRPVNRREGACYHPRQVEVVAGALELSIDAIDDPRCLLKDGVTQAGYVGGLVNTRETFTYTYGYAEARIYLPGSGGSVYNWPAFWQTGFDWPVTGEIDIAEGLSGGQPCAVYHWAGGGGEHLETKQCANWADPSGWHVYAVHWQPGRITYYYDGVELFSVSDAVVGDPHYLIIDNTVRINGEGTVAPATIAVDYVRVWSS